MFYCNCCLNKEEIKLAITVKIEGAQEKEISFPCLMKDCESGLVVLFTNAKEGTVLSAARGWSIGSYHSEWLSATNKAYWEPSPPITLSNS